MVLTKPIKPSPSEAKCHNYSCILELFRRMAELKALAKIISSSIDKIQAACDAKNVSFPSLDEPFTPEAETIRVEVFADAIPVIAAAHQLIATLQLPIVSAFGGAVSVNHGICSCCSYLTDVLEGEHFCIR